MKRKLMGIFAFVALSLAGTAAIGDVVAFLNSDGNGLRVDSNGDILGSGDITAGDDIVVTDRATTKSLSLGSSSSNATTTWTVANGTTLRVVGTVAGNISWTIPSAATAGADAVVHIVDQSGALDSTHTVTINSTSGNINGSATKAFSTAYGQLWLESNGTHWFGH